MVNRTIAAKDLKRKRRGRFAIFSGATTRFASRTIEVLELEGEDKSRVKRVEIPVGPVSLSKQVINTGRGPSHERMAEYYNRVNHESYTTTLKEDLGIKDPRYQQVWLDTPKENRISLVSDSLGRLDLYFSGQQWFFVDIDYRRHTIKRSRVYGSRAFALGRLKSKRIAWVEIISTKVP